jgi:hypothetical protein
LADIVALCSEFRHTSGGWGPALVQQNGMPAFAGTMEKSRADAYHAFALFYKLTSGNVRVVIGSSRREHIETSKE